MPPKIFITGITGYIGGDLFHHLTQHHADYEFSALIRTKEKAKYLTDLYPNVRVVLGELDDAEKIERESAWADIVIRMSLSIYPVLPTVSYAGKG
jgi:uncharacterized protein YbjT (DUF2867 family)